MSGLTGALAYKQLVRGSEIFPLMSAWGQSLPKWARRATSDGVSFDYLVMPRRRGPKARIRSRRLFKAAPWGTHHGSDKMETRHFSRRTDGSFAILRAHLRRARAPTRSPLRRAALHTGGKRVLEGLIEQCAWSIPKGEMAEGEDATITARREFLEETGCDLCGPFVPLGEVRQRGGKRVIAFAVEGDRHKEQHV
jgi:hypothetical protein